MDLKLVFYVLSLILLVAYEAEARKIAEGNIQGKRLNLPLAQVHLSSNGDVQNNQGYNYNHQQANTENAQVDNPLIFYGDLQNNQGYNYNHQQANIENAQVDNPLIFYGDLQNNQGYNYNHQQANTENAQVDNPLIFYGDLSTLISYGDLQNKDDTKTKNAHIHSYHVDPSVRVFFILDDLKVNKEISVSFPRRAWNFLPKDEADSIPFSRKEFSNLLQRFAISRNSPQAKAMEETLRVCEFPPIKGETKNCATSPEAMLDFVQGIMGEKTQVKPLSTTHSSNSTPLLQKYTVLDAPQEVETPKMVACHTMPYAYAIFYCHYTISKSKVFKVSLRGENGDRVEAIAACHLDTSDWSPSHISFRLLGVLPGTSPICHFFPSDNLVWVSKIANAQVT